jgi:hypothetical protein
MYIIYVFLIRTLVFLVTYIIYILSGCVYSGHRKLLGEVNGEEKSCDPVPLRMKENRLGFRFSFDVSMSPCPCVHVHVSISPCCHVFMSPFLHFSMFSYLHFSCFSVSSCFHVSMSMSQLFQNSATGKRK